MTELMKKKVELWNSMSDEKKKPYEDLAAQDKVRYEAELT
jgi:hypothetical protein